MVYSKVSKPTISTLEIDTRDHNPPKEGCMIHHLMKKRHDGWQGI